MNNQKGFANILILILILAIIGSGGYLYVSQADDVEKDAVISEDESIENIKEESESNLPISIDEVVTIDTNQEISNNDVTSNIKQEVEKVPLDTVSKELIVDDGHTCADPLAREGEFEKNCDEYIFLQTYDTDMTKWKSYTDNKYGFSFKYPSKFTVEEVAPTGSEDYIKRIALDANVSVTVRPRQNMRIPVLHSGFLHYDTSSWAFEDYDNSITDLCASDALEKEFTTTFTEDEVPSVHYATGDSYWAVYRWYIDTGDYLIEVSNSNGHFGNSDLGKMIVNTFKVSEPDSVLGLGC